LDCHNAKKKKGKFRVDNLSVDFVNGGAVMKWAEIMERINSGEMPPEDEKQPSEKEMADFTQAVANQIKEGEAERLAKREKVTFHKLTREEYSNTIKDLLGVTYNVTDPGGLSEDPSYHGFQRIGSVLTLSPSHIEKYYAAAEDILDEAMPEKAPEIKKDHFKPQDLRGYHRYLPKDPELLKKMRIDLWPGITLAGHPGAGKVFDIKQSGNYTFRIKASGLKPADGLAPRLTFYAVELDRMLYAKPLLAAEDKPVVIEFTTHLPAGSHTIRVTNESKGPENLHRAGRNGERPFYSLREGREPWQYKLTDEDYKPILPIIIVDWLEFEGPVLPSYPTPAQKEFLPSEGEQNADIRKYVRKFASKSFRRPAHDYEVDHYSKLVESELKKGEKINSALKAAYQAILCSKNFIYIVEGNEKNNEKFLNNWEIANRLSYFLWSTMPDQELENKALNGALQNPDELRHQIQRILKHPYAKNFTRDFPTQWLQLSEVGKFTPDPKLYPDYDSYLEESMVEETLGFFSTVLNENLSLKEFLNSNWTVVNARLATHYDIPVSELNFHKIQLKDEYKRGGLLTQASILSLTSDGTRHRPIHRGAWLLESIFDRPPPPPPANVDPVKTTPTNQPKATLRMKLEAHISDPNCASCHKKIDPLGFAFDNYDAVGRWRTHEVVSDGQGDNPKVDASGQLPDGRKYKNANEFKQLLVDDIDKFNEAFVEKLSTFALRRTMTYDDKDSLARIAAESRKNGYKLQAVIEALVLSDIFKRR
ncbi:MAG: DUF1592 domain-containing protein, partial [Lentisphaeraceae bacterium]|nr:DUF1592 domain-containing protein [Lentisphaeraceae bacterium]